MESTKDQSSDVKQAKLIWKFPSWRLLFSVWPMIGNESRNDHAFTGGSNWSNNALLFDIISVNESGISSLPILQ